jgi:WD40 repeat protein
MPEAEARRGGPSFFLPDGSSLVFRPNTQDLLLCRVETRTPDHELLWSNEYGRFECVLPGPDGRYVCVNNKRQDRVVVVPVDGSEPIVLEGPQGIINGLDVEPGGRRVAVSGGQLWAKDLPDEPIITVHDLQTGGKQVLEAEGECGFFEVGFLPGDRLFSYSHEGLLLWDLATGEYERISERVYMPGCDADPTGRYLLVLTPVDVRLWDLEERVERVLPIPVHGYRDDRIHPPLPVDGHPRHLAQSLAIAPDASFVVVGLDRGGKVLVLDLETETLHTLLGHDEETQVGALWISPDSREIRTAGDDGLVLSWDVPTGTDPLTAPYPEFMAYLRAQTNMRVVPDVDAADGFRIDYDPFPGWADPPAWK